MKRSSRRLEVNWRGERRVTTAAIRAPELEWHQGFGRMMADLLRRYAGEDTASETEHLAWYNRPWSDADRVAARKIDIHSF